MLISMSRWPVESWVCRGRGYYDWLGRPPSARDEANSLLLKHIQDVHADSRGTYGWPRVHAELTLGLGGCR
jgi:putative transposase